MNNHSLHILVCLILAGIACCSRLKGQLLVGNGPNEGYLSVNAYNFNGTPIKIGFATTTLEVPQGMATDGTNLYVADFKYGEIDKFNLFTGQIIKSFGVGPGVEGIAIAGTNLYVANFNGFVGEYTVNGTVINRSLITFTNEEADGIAIVGMNLYVTYFDASGYVGEFNLDGTVVNAKLIGGLANPAGLTSDGTYLYVPNFDGGTIGKYGLDGTTNDAALISGLRNPNGLTINGSTLYVLENSGHVLSFTLNGVSLNSALITNSISASGSPYGILSINALAASPPAIQSNGFTFNITGVSNQSVVVSASAGLAGWTPIQTNVIGSGPFLFSDPTWTNYPSRFYRTEAQ